MRFLRFLRFLPSAVTFYASGFAQELFSSDSTDVSDFQYLSPDLLASQELPIDSNWISNNDDLFGGSDTTDLFSSGIFDHSSDLDATDPTLSGTLDFLRIWKLPVRPGVGNR